MKNSAYRVYKDEKRGGNWKKGEIFNDFLK
jgi:hypothetical protein